MRDSYGSTGLHLVTSEERWDLVSVLIQYGADTNLCVDGNSALHEAVAQQEVPPDVASLLISPYNINMVGWNGSPLHLTIGNGRWDLVEMMLRHGADVNLENEDGQTPLGKYCGSVYDPLVLLASLIPRESRHTYAAIILCD